MTRTNGSTDGHYLNLPVMSLEGEIVGMVDVLKLTYATLDQINSMSTGDSEGPAWNKFWMSIDHETESMLSGEGSAAQSRNPQEARSHVMSPDFHRPGVERLDSVAPGDSASHAGVESPSGSAVGGAMTSPADVPFPFKFKAPSGRTHRLAIASSAGLSSLISVVAEKLGSETSQLGGTPTFDADTNALSASGFALAYLDNEGDTVSITTDADLLDAITLARSAGREKVDLFVHHPEKPALSVTLNPAPAMPTPPESVRDRRSLGVQSEEESADEETDFVSEKRKGKKRERVAEAVGAKSGQEQVIAGVPNELLLPGAIVTLAVVIVGVFAFTRGSKN